MLKWWCSCVAASVDWTAVRRWSADDAATASCSAAATAAAAAIWQLCCWHCTRTLCQRLPGHRCHDISRQADGFDKGPTFGHWLSVSHNCCSFSTVYFIFKIVFVNSFIQPSLRLCKPTYSVLVPSPEIARVVARRASSVKIPWDAWRGLPVLDVAAAGLLVIIVQWEVWLRWDYRYSMWLPQAC